QCLAKFVNAEVKRFITCLSSSVRVVKPNMLFLKRYSKSPQWIAPHRSRIEMIEDVEIHGLICNYCLLLPSISDSDHSPFFSKTRLCSPESHLQSRPI
ncbi:hypothetical protein PENTCL1PPCAC_25375, partial [Pristionchus entomophagus]